MAKRKKVKPIQYVYCVAYIQPDKIRFTESELARYPEYADIEAILPTVSILTKQFKGKEYFRRVPIMFNYGIFKMPMRKSAHTEFLMQMKTRITCIVGWLKKEGKKTKGDPKVATASRSEVKDLLHFAEQSSVYTREDVQNLKVNQLITLIGYPWDGMEAVVLEVFKDRKKAKVRLAIDHELDKPIEISFDNIFYTIYHGGYDVDKTKEKVFDQPLRSGGKRDNHDDEQD